jgi:hypothetical protein
MVVESKLLSVEVAERMNRGFKVLLGEISCGEKGIELAEGNDVDGESGIFVVKLTSILG